MRLLLPAALCLFIASCDIINPDEEEPGYIHIPSFTMDVLPGQGTTSEKITEVWVYAEEQIVGVYDLPADIPVIGNGLTDILIFGGIKNNGISTTRIRYPFFKPYRATIDLQPFSRDTIIPSFAYFEDVVIAEKDFENGNIMIPAGTNQGLFNVTTDPAYVFEGERSGIGTLESGQTILYFKDDDNLILNAGQPIFLEMDYSCNNSLSVGLLAANGSSVNKNLAVIINPTTLTVGLPRWNKIYIDLGLIPLQNPNAQYFEFYVEVIPDEPGREVELLLDNLKLVQWP